MQSASSADGLHKQRQSLFSSTGHFCESRHRRCFARARPPRETTQVSCVALVVGRFSVASTKLLLSLSLSLSLSPSLRLSDVCTRISVIRLIRCGQAFCWRKVNPSFGELLCPQSVGFLAIRCTLPRYCYAALGSLSGIRNGPKSPLVLRASDHIHRLLYVV